MKPANDISSCLWFDGRAEEVASFYTSVFDNAEITAIRLYDKPSAEASGNQESSVMTVSLDIEEFSFIGLNGGPQFKMNPSISFFVNCETKAEVNGLCENQEEIDDYWDKLSAVPKAEACGWLKDKYGVSWQIVPKDLNELLDSQEATEALMQMKKIDIEQLKQASH